MSVIIPICSLYQPTHPPSSPIQILLLLLLVRTRNQVYIRDVTKVLDPLFKAIIDTLILDV